MSIESAFFGALGQDAERKVSKSKKPYLRFSVRVGDGDEAQWVFVFCFDPSAIELADRFVKGARVYVEGRLSFNEWTNADGVVKTGLSVMSFHTRLSQIGSQKVLRDRETPHTKVSVAAGNTFHDDDIPFAPEI